MSWRYEKVPDYLTVKSTTVVETPHSRYGVAYKFGGACFFNIPKMATELWTKCDAYFTSSYSNGDRIGIAFTLPDGTDCGFWNNAKNITDNCFLFVNENNSFREISSTAFARNSFHTFLLHMKSDSSNGIVELWIDGNLKSSFSGGDVNHGNIFDTIKIYADSSILVSNVIISDAEIGLYENTYWDRDGLRETPLTFNREKILAGYNLDEISNSLFQYNDAVKSLIDLLLYRIKIYEDSKQSTIQKKTIAARRVSGFFVGIGLCRNQTA